MVSPSMLLLMRMVWTMMMVAVLATLIFSEATVVRVNLYVRSFEKIDDVKV